MPHRLLPITFLSGFLGAGDRHFDEGPVREAPDACRLNFTEKRKGTKSWRELRDPFPSWERRDVAGEALA